MKNACVLTAAFCLLLGMAMAPDRVLGQQDSGAPVPPQMGPSSAPIDVNRASPPPTPTGNSTYSLGPDSEPLSARVHRLLDDFNQRHQERVQEMASYDQAAEGDANLKQLADPRKVEVELKDERDREQTSKSLASEYAQEATTIVIQKRSLVEFLAKRRKALDDLNRRSGVNNQQDLELAAANLARQPGTEAQVADIRRRLADAERNNTDAAVKRPQLQIQIAGAEEELKRVQTLEQSLDKESKAYLADAASAHQNTLNLADRLEFYMVQAKVEDVLDKDREAAEKPQHLSASQEVRDTLASPMPVAKVAAPPDAAKDCAEKSPDGKDCAEAAAEAPKPTAPKE